MTLKTYKPTTKTTRHLIGIDRSELYKGAPVKTLVEGKTSTGGRNNHGHITSRRMGGGAKKAYRLVDFKRQKLDMPAVVERLEYDPNRTAFIALIKYITCSVYVVWISKFIYIVRKLIVIKNYFSLTIIW